MPAYALCNLRAVHNPAALDEYLSQIDATLEPYGGRFLTHGGTIDVWEGDWQGGLAMIEFADRETATAWYRSDAYSAIRPLRVENSDCVALVSDGVAPGHKAADAIGKHLA